MTRLLMLTSNRTGRGTYWRAMGFAEQLAKLDDYQVTLISIAPQKINTIQTRQMKQVTLVETPDLMPASGYDPLDSWRRIRWLKDKSFDLIHAFESRPVVIGPALFAKKRMNAPLITDWCDWFGKGGSVERRQSLVLRTFLRPIETFFEERFRPLAQGTTVINSILYKKALGLGIPDEQLLLLPNGANVNDIVPKEKRPLRRSLGLEVEAVYFAYTGSIFYEDAELMAQAFDQIITAVPAARLLIIGYCNVDIRSLVQYPTAVIQTGPLTYAQLADYVAAADIGFLPLCNNGANQGRFPMKAHDFMTAGVPLLVTDVGDLGDFIVHWQVGQVAADDPVQIMKVAEQMVANLPKLKSMGQHARQVSESHFSWPVVTQSLHKFYQDILKSHHQQPAHSSVSRS